MTHVIGPFERDLTGKERADLGFAPNGEPYVYMTTYHCQDCEQVLTFLSTPSTLLAVRRTAARIASKHECPVEESE